MKMRLLVLGTLAMILVGCSSSEEASGPDAPARTADSPSVSPGESMSPSPTGRLMPDLVGLPSVEAGERLADLELGSRWGRPVTVRCGVRPRTVVRQQPAAGSPLEPDTTVRIRTASLDLDRFRGPCEPSITPTGEVAKSDVALAGDFYRFAADPSLGARFADGDVWVGIEDGPVSTTLSGASLADLAAWELETEYAERGGPFSALDTLAESGGHFALGDGVAATCPQGNAKPPRALRGLRALSLTSPDDVTSACYEWWSVTLFLDAQDRIRGVALRLGSP